MSYRYEPPPIRQFYSLTGWCVLRAYNGESEEILLAIAHSEFPKDELEHALKFKQQVPKNEGGGIRFPMAKHLVPQIYIPVYA